MEEYLRVGESEEGGELDDVFFFDCYFCFFDFDCFIVCYLMFFYDVIGDCEYYIYIYSVIKCIYFLICV